LNRRTYLLLFGLSLGVQFAIAQFQAFPGYLDSDYYFAGGLQLVRGKGFTEPYLWNYLDDPAGLPHASHAYWNPLASIVTAIGMWGTGNQTYAAGRLPFILIAALTPPLSAALAYSYTKRPELAVTSGLLAVFCVYHAPFLPVPDNFGLFMLLGGSNFMLATRPRPWFWLGVLSGLMTLARSDGMLWLALTVLLLAWRHRREDGPRAALENFGLAAGGFLVIMLPWYARNYAAYGALMAPGGSRALWLDRYEQTFTYPASQLSFASWLEIGWQGILADRLWALGQNLQSAIAAHGAIVLFPFILVGMWVRRADERVRLAAFGWLVLFAVMTLVFPFAGARGGFFHGGAAFQPLWWTLAPIGLDTIVASARKRGWFTGQAQNIFRVALVQVIVLLTAYVVWQRLFKLGWGEGELLYPKIDSYLVAKGARLDDVVIVRNPPGYYLSTGRSAIAIPYGYKDTILEVADRYQADFLVLEAKGVLPGIKDLFESPQVQYELEYLGEVDGARIFRVQAN